MADVKPLSAWQKFRRFLSWAALDFIIIVLAHLIAYSARLLVFPMIELESLVFIGIAALLYISILHLHRAYRIYWHRASGHNVAILFRSSLWASSLLTFLDMLIYPRAIPLSVLWVAMIIAFGGLVIVRYRSRLIGALEWRWRAVWKQEFPNANAERVLIVGAGESGQHTALRLKRGLSDTRYQLVGFVDDDPRKHDMLIEGAQVLGFTDSVGEIVRLEKIDLIVVAIHNISGAKLRKILQACEASSARVKLVPDMRQLFDTRLNKNFLRDVQAEDLIGRSSVSRHAAVDLAPLEAKVVLITGAAGSIGSELARQALQYLQPTKLIILDSNESGLYDLHHELLLKYHEALIEPALVDITQSEVLMAVFAQYRPNLVFHAAAYKHVPLLEQHPNQAVRVNIGGTLKVADAALRYQVDRFVLVSSDKAVNPSSVMGASKRIGELIIHALSEQKTHHTRFTAVRFGNVLGSRGSVVPLFNLQIDNGGPVTVTDKRMTRYFMSIAEAVNLVIHAAALTVGNDIFVLKMGEVVKIDDLARRMIRLRGLRPEQDIPIKYTGVRSGEKLHEVLNAEFEHLHETSHPAILRHNDWNMAVSSADFMATVYQLVQKGVSEDNQALAQLRAICGLKNELGKTGD